MTNSTCILSSSQSHLLFPTKRVFLRHLLWRGLSPSSICLRMPFEKGLQRFPNGRAMISSKVVRLHIHAKQKNNRNRKSIFVPPKPPPIQKNISWRFRSLPSICYTISSEKRIFAVFFDNVRHCFPFAYACPWNRSPNGEVDGSSLPWDFFYHRQIAILIKWRNWASPLPNDRY